MRYFFLCLSYAAFLSISSSAQLENGPITENWCTSEVTKVERADLQDVLLSDYIIVSRRDTFQTTEKEARSIPFDHIDLVSGTLDLALAYRELSGCDISVDYRGIYRTESFEQTRECFDIFTIRRAEKSECPNQLICGRTGKEVVAADVVNKRAEFYLATVGKHLENPPEHTPYMLEEVQPEQRYIDLHVVNTGFRDLSTQQDDLAVFETEIQVRLVSRAEGVVSILAEVRLPLRYHKYGRLFSRCSAVIDGETVMDWIS